MLSEHLSEVLWDIPKTALGFFLGLTLHRFVGIFTDKRAFRAMLRTIHSEVKSNEIVLTKSFLKFHADGLVLREFSTETTAEYLKGSRFLEHARREMADLLHQYVRNLALANSYRAKAEDFRIDKPGTEWLAPLLEVWGKNLSDCQKDIRKLDKILKPSLRLSWWEQLIGHPEASDGSE